MIVFELPSHTTIVCTDTMSASHFLCCDEENVTPLFFKLQFVSRLAMLDRLAAWLNGTMVILHC